MGKHCTCESCILSRKVRRLINRLKYGKPDRAASEDAEKTIRDLMNRLASAEMDMDYYRAKAEILRIKG